jgi:hypothetical protein
MTAVVRKLLSSDATAEKLGRRGIAVDEARQLIRNFHVVLHNPRQRRRDGCRRLMVGYTSGGRALALAIEQTLEPNDWLVITGWDSANHERKVLER